MSLFIVLAENLCLILKWQTVYSAPRVNSAKQVALAPEKRGPPRAEGDRVRCDALARTIHEIASISRRDLFSQ